MDLIRRLLRDDRGFTVAELMMTVFLMGVVMAILYTSLNTFTRTTDATQNKAFSLAETRTAIERVAKQIRAANPIDGISPVSRYDNEISFSVYCSTMGVKGCGADHLRPVSYRMTGNSIVETLGTSVSTAVGPQGPAAVPQAQRRGAIVNLVSQPVFRYFGKDGQQFATSGSSAPPSTTFRDCTKSVEIFLTVVSEHRNPSNTIDLSTRVDLRNYNEVAGC